MATGECGDIWQGVLTLGSWKYDWLLPDVVSSLAAIVKVQVAVTMVALASYQGLPSYTCGEKCAEGLGTRQGSVVAFRCIRSATELCGES